MDVSITMQAKVPAFNILAAGGAQGGIQPEVGRTLSDADLQRVTAPRREI